MKIKINKKVLYILDTLILKVKAKLTMSSHLVTKCRIKSPPNYSDRQFFILTIIFPYKKKNFFSKERNLLFEKNKKTIVKNDNMLVTLLLKRLKNISLKKNDSSPENGTQYYDQFFDLNWKEEKVTSKIISLSLICHELSISQHFLLFSSSTSFI